MREVISLINYVLRVCKKRVYYFDENKIYKSISLEMAKKRNLKGIHFVSEDRCFLDVRYSMYFPEIEYCTENLVLWKKAVTKLKEGDTIEDFKNYLSSTRIESHEKPSGVDRFIGKIDKPIFVREPENENKNTFDYIYIDILIIQNWETDKMEYIKENMYEIRRRVVEKLQNDRSFEKYGVPINFLKISRITLKRDSILQFVFELKEI